MSNEERLNSLRKRLTPEMESAVRAALDAGRLPSSLVSALYMTCQDALNQGESLESMALKGSAPLDQLEAIVKLVGRPPLLVRNDAVVLEPLPDLPPNTSALIKAVEKWVPSVGRIEFSNHSMAWGGTGWVVDKKGNGALVVTNRHVAQLVAGRKADGTAVFLRSPSGARYGASIDFREEVGSKRDDNSRTAKLTRIDYLADDTTADVALLFIEAASFTLPDPFNLIASNKDVSKDDLVALIGYPAYDSRNDANAQAQYFRDLYEVKRFAPGRILQPAGDGETLTYDCTSLGGNSGSPLIRLEDGKVVGLHFSGLYLSANTAVSAETIHALVNGSRPVSVALRALREQEAVDGSHPVSYFKGRKGFDTSFLSASNGHVVKTPWPELSAPRAAGLAVPSDDPPEPNELCYRHFGVKYSAKTKVPLITAVNIDGAQAVRIKRGNDRWFSDERIDTALQLNADNFKDSEIDRGHMVRREDPNWGEADEAQQANDDTFHYVNAAAQHSLLNQGKTLWQGLENYILDSVRTHGFKACVFTGPILRDENDPDDVVIDGAVVPQEFWKVVATLDAADRKLHATAYLLSQGQLIQKLLEKRSKKEAQEGVVLGAYRTFQVAIKDLGDATGYDFSAYVEADPLSKTQPGQEAVANGEPVYLPLEDVTDIVL